MTPDSLRPLLEEGVILVFSKVLNASHHVRACCAVEFDHRKGFHVVERNLKQLRKERMASWALLAPSKSPDIKQL